MDRVLQQLIANSTGEVQFFDIGANVGFVSLLACSLAPHRVRAHCFEPNSMAAQRLHEHAAMNAFNMTINTYALGDAAGRLTMTLGAESSNSTLVPGGFAEAGGVDITEVEVRTLDEYCAEYGVTPTIAKLDVEGFEPHVLRGSTRTLTTKRPILVVEVNSKALAAGGSSAIGLLGQIEQFGYHTYLIDPRQVEMTANARQARSRWRGYPEVRREDFNGSRLCDLLAIPE